MAEEESESETVYGRWTIQATSLKSSACEQVVAIALSISLPLFLVVVVQIASFGFPFPICAEASDCWGLPKKSEIVASDGLSSTATACVVATDSASTATTPLLKSPNEFLAQMQGTSQGINFEQNFSENLLSVGFLKINTVMNFTQKLSAPVVMVLNSTYNLTYVPPAANTRALTYDGRCFLAPCLFSNVKECPWFLQPRLDQLLVLGFMLIIVGCQVTDEQARACEEWELVVQRTPTSKQRTLAQAVCYGSLWMAHKVVRHKVLPVYVICYVLFSVLNSSDGGSAQAILLNALSITFILEADTMMSIMFNEWGVFLTKIRTILKTDEDEEDQAESLLRESEVEKAPPPAPPDDAAATGGRKRIIQRKRRTDAGLASRLVFFVAMQISCAHFVITVSDASISPEEGGVPGYFIWRSLVPIIAATVFEHGYLLGLHFYFKQSGCRRCVGGALDSQRRTSFGSVASQQYGHTWRILRPFFSEMAAMTGVMSLTTIVTIFITFGHIDMGLVLVLTQLCIQSPLNSLLSFTFCLLGGEAIFQSLKWWLRCNTARLEVGEIELAAASKQARGQNHSPSNLAAGI